MNTGAYANDFYLPACNDSERNVTRLHFDTPLSDSEQWTIYAQTLYKGEYENRYGSRLFHAYLCEVPFKNGNEACGGSDNVNNDFTYESKLCFYMRPPADSYDGSQGGKLLLANNTNNTPDVLNIDTENGTLFTFQIISDGTGTVLVNVWVAGNNGEQPYTKTYTNHEIGTVYGVAAGSAYDVEGYVLLGASQPILTKPADVNFRTVFLNKTATKKLIVNGVNLKGNITGAVSGKSADAFNLATASVPGGGELEIEYTPTALVADSALLTLSSPDADPVEINLVGEGGEAPVEFSSEDGSNEHWYYIQYFRRSGEAKVWTAGAKGDTIAQRVLTPDSFSQQWKIYGDWDEYGFASRSGSEMDYNITDDVYLNEELLGGNFFGLVRYKDTQDWQVQNKDKTFINKTTGEDVPGKNYLNDFQGKSICSFTIDDSGNQLVFIPVTAEKFFAGPDSIGYGTVPIGYPSTRRYPVVKLNFSSDVVEYAFSGNEAGVFSAQLTATDSLYIIFDPNEAIAYNATLTLTAGAKSHTIQLTGTGFQIPTLPFKVSDDENEYWYQIQFNRQNTKAFQDNGIGEKITQVEKIDGQENQLWKITGLWDNYRIVAKSGNEFKFDTGTSRYIAAATGEGNKFRVAFNDSDGWAELYNLTINTTGSYINDAGGNGGSELGNYYHNDPGDKINFLATFATIVATDFPFGEIEAGASFTKEQTVSSIGLSSPITYTLSGADAGAFTATAVEDDDDTTPVLEPNTLYQEGGKLSITFAPTEKRAYSATLTFSAAGADDVSITLSGTADFVLPVKITTTAIDNWYTIAFKRQAAKVLAIDEFGTLAQVDKPTGLPTDAQLWKFTGTPTQGYRVVNKTGPAILYAPSSYTLTAEGEEGDNHRFIRAGNGTDWQLYNLTTEGSSGHHYLNDYNNDGLSAALYSVNDGGNYLIFNFISGETAIQTPGIDGDIVASTRYYTLQGLAVKKPAQTGIYIRQDRYASGRVKASKVYIVVR
jgi:hypothetical protein